MLPTSPLTLFGPCSPATPCAPSSHRHAKATVRAGAIKPARGQAAPVAEAQGRLFGGAP